MDIKCYDIYSEKYDIKGAIQDWMFSFDVVFEYEGKSVRIALDRPFPFPGEEGLKQIGIEAIETYMEKLKSGKVTERKTMLHEWYVTEVERDGMKKLCVKGVVTGHPEFTDSTKFYDTGVMDIIINLEDGEALISSKHGLYHCPLEYCSFSYQDKEPLLIPKYEEIKEKYQGKITYPSIEPGKVLLVLSNFSEYYFHSLYYQPEGEEESLDYSGHAHIGTFQDSYLISTEDYRIDLRYFPHFQNIEFYSEDTDGRPWFIENIGDVVLYARTSAGLLCLNPGERKEVKKENTEKDKPILPGGDLYPPGFIE